MANPEIINHSRLLGRDDEHPDAIYDACPFIPEGAPVVLQIGAFSSSRVLTKWFPNNTLVKQVGKGSFAVEIDVYAQATRQIAEAGVDGTFSIRAPADHIPMRNESVDLLIVSNVWGENPNILGKRVGFPFPRSQKTMAEFSRVLRGGGVGKIVIIEWYTPDEAAQVLKDLDFAALGLKPELVQSGEISDRIRNLGGREDLQEKLKEEVGKSPGQIEIVGKNRLPFTDAPFVLILTKS